MDNEITTSDMDLILNLLTLKHKPTKVEYDNGLVRYTFNADEVQKDIDLLTRNEPITVDIRDVWAANKVWSMNRSRAKNR